MSSSDPDRTPTGAMRAHDPNAIEADYGSGEELGFAGGEFFDPEGEPAFASEAPSKPAGAEPGPRAAGPRLTLSGGTPAVETSRPRASTDENVLLDVAIDRSSEPSQREVERHERASKSQIRFYRDPELLAEDTGDRGEPIALGFAALLAATLLFFGWMAWQNEGVLDFRDFGASLRGALNTEAVGGDALAAQEAQAPLPPPVAVEEDVAELSFRNLRVSLHRAGDGRAFVLVDGDLRHDGGVRVRRAQVDVSLRDRDGELLGTLRVPAGATLDDVAIDLITDEASLSERLAELGQRAAALELVEDQRTPFRAIFPTEGPVRPSNLRAEARIATLEVRSSPTCWELRAQEEQDPDE